MSSPLRSQSPASDPNPNGVAKKVNGIHANGVRATAARPPPNKLSRPGDTGKAVRAPANRLSRPGDVAKAHRPPPSRLSRPGDVAKSQKAPARTLSRPGDAARSSSSSRVTASIKTRPRVAEVRDCHKRKSSSPATPAFGSSSEGESDVDMDDLRVRKKSKMSPQHSGDPKRHIEDPSSWLTEHFNSLHIISGTDLVCGAVSSEYMDAFEVDDGHGAEIPLAYPSTAPKEQFKILKPRKGDEYNPHDDVCETMRQVLANYFTTRESEKHLDEATGLLYRLTRAYNRKNFLGYKKVVEEFNGLVQISRNDGTLRKTLSEMRAVPLALVQRILNQTTARTISPNNDKLKNKTSEKSNTYGELWPPFNSMIFRETCMSSSSVFLDLGSGVGNVVLQAALEMGCETHGIEIQPECCRLARMQEAEFSSRCKMWGLSHGSIDLLEGNFLEDPRLAPILQRADVVLVNNEVFDARVNEQLTSLFLDLKDGAKIVSLKSFVPEGWHLDERRRESVQGTLEVEKKSYWSHWVSWKHDSGEYFIATKDTGRIERILGKKRHVRG